MAYGAFQPDAFQNNAFQMDDTPAGVVVQPGGGGGGGGRKREIDWRTYGHPIIGIRKKRKPDEDPDEAVEELVEALVESVLPASIAAPLEPIIVGPDAFDVAQSVAALQQAERMAQEAAALQLRLEDEADMRFINETLEGERREVMAAIAGFMALLKKLS